MKILVSGGAGFIGSHTVDLLIENGFDVVAMDNLEPQVHGNLKPDYLNPDAKFIFGDVTNPDTWKNVLKDIDAVIHLAALVGVKQSMSLPFRYLNVNILGTVRLYETLSNNPKLKKNIQKIIVASSASIYGEGAYQCKNCGIVFPSLRSKKQLEKKDWEIHCPKCGEYAKPIPTSEDKPPLTSSIYALSKYTQEKISLNYASVLDIPTTALRYFNVYGPRQSLINPYTGVCTIFSSKIKNNKIPIVYEDGLQTRDFIYVKDVARANLFCLDKFNDVDFFNVASGRQTNISEIAEIFVKLHNSKLNPKIIGQSRIGDVRHSFGDVSKIEKIGFVAKTPLKKGLKKLIEWNES